MKPFTKASYFEYSEGYESGEVEAELKKLALQPTTSNTPHTCGFVNVEHEFQSKGSFLIRLFGQVYISVFCIEKRSPTTSQVDILYKRKILKLMEELEEGQSITQKKQREVRKEAKQELMSQVDPVQTHVHVAWDFKKKLVIADTTNKKDRKELQDKLAEVEIKLETAEIFSDIEGCLEEILEDPNKTLSDEFDVGDQVSMAGVASNGSKNDSDDEDSSSKKNASSKSTVTYKNQDLVGSEIESNRNEEKLPTAIGLVHMESVGFVLTVDQSITSVKAKTVETDYMVKLLEDAAEVEQNEPEKTDYFQKMAATLMMACYIYQDLSKMNESVSDMGQYLMND